MPIPVCVCVYVRVCVCARWGSAMPHINRPFSGQQRGVLQLAAALASYWTQQRLAREAQGSVLSPFPAPHAGPKSQRLPTCLTYWLCLRNLQDALLGLD